MSRLPYFALVLCRRDRPDRQWVAPAWWSREEAIRSQGRLLTHSNYAHIKPLYRLHVRPKPLPTPSPAHQPLTEGSAR